MSRRRGSIAPPPDSNDPREPTKGIGAWRFPEWFVVQEASGSEERERSRRLVHRKALDDKGRFDGRPVVATRFVRACPKGHVDDLDWQRFVHGAEDACRRQLWLDERGTSGDLADLVVRCECGKSRSLYEATLLEMNPLGTCRGARPWLGRNTEEDCKLPSRLLIRTASNAYFPQVVSVLSLPDRGSAVETAVRELWDDLQIVDDAVRPRVSEEEAEGRGEARAVRDDEVLAAIREAKGGKADERPVKQVELEALLAAPEGFGDDVPVDPNFHARRLPDRAWRHSKRSDGIEAVVQLHRLREVLALVGFTRFEAVTPDINGEYETDVERAQIALEPAWFPAVENRGEGIVRPASRDSSDELARAAGRQAAARCPCDAGTSTGRRTARASARSRAALRAAAHALAPAHPVARHALRLSRQLHPRADLCGHRGPALRHPPLHGKPRRGGDPRRPCAAGAAHRGSSRAGAEDERALLERSDLRPARAGREHGEPLAPRRRLPRLRAGRRDLLRDAQRLPRPGAGRAGARRPATLPSSRPSHDRRAARSAVPPPRAACERARVRAFWARLPPPLRSRSVLGHREDVEDLVCGVA